MESILDNLNASQRTAVEYNDGPSLVIAGAGSGKTRVLTYKIAYLIKQGLAPWNILALTFTNKAANEMKQRIGRLIGDEKARYINMGTFHSVFSHILRQEAELLGYSSQFTIYDEADSRSLIKSIVKELNLDDKTYRPGAVHSRISMAKNSIVNAQAYADNAMVAERDRNAQMKELGKIYLMYEQRCRTSNAMDFDDLLMLTFQLFDEHEDVRKKWAGRFKYVLVDEYQDTNRVQQKIVEQLCREDKRVCVVGDDAQSIYAFRGANIDNILEFNKIYPEAKLFKLEQNYRSTKRIVEAANSLIVHNSRQIPKNVFSENALGDALEIKNAYSDREEAAIVQKEILRLKREENAEYSDFAILYRTNAQSRAFEEEFLKKGIPYKIVSGQSFYQRKEIKDVIAYFRLVANHDDEEAFKRIVNYPARGIGDATVARIAETAQKWGVSFWNVAFQPEHYQLNLATRTQNKLREFTNLILSFSDRIETDNAFELGRAIIKQSGIYADLHSSNEPEYITRQENLDEFMAALEDFVEGCREEGREAEALLTLFLQDVALQTDKESDDGNASKVLMMTVHAAKGLEFPTVFIVGMEEEVFPSLMSMSSQREMEEERRLLYVAITRAEKHCILTWAKNRWRYGKQQTMTKSRFLGEIDREHVNSDGLMSFGQTANTHTPWSGDNAGRWSRIQNSRPVADQFRADVKPKVTRQWTPEPPTDPLSPSFRESMRLSRMNPSPGHGAQAGGFRQASQSQAMESAASHGLSVGTVIEHQRFGIGTVLKLEGVGDDAKATVEFRNTGTKQLLLKFAKFSIVH